MKIYTKTGDLGETSLLGGKRVLKSNTRIQAYGTIDELNSYLGMVADQEVNKDRIPQLKEIQDRLFTIGSHLALESDKKINLPFIEEKDITFLESLIDEMDAQLPSMKNFVLPGGHISISFVHVARCVCRRAERCIISINEEKQIDPLIIKYINRLSDYLFVLARKMALELGVEETPWKPRD